MTETRSLDAYAEQLRALFPRGRGWPEARGPVWDQLLRSLAPELARIDARLGDLIEEADPRTTVEALEDHERVLGLPDPCLGFGQTIDERRQMVVALYLMRGGQTPEYYQKLALLFGREIEVIEVFPSIADESAAGDELAEQFVTADAGSSAGEFLLDAAAPFAWWTASAAAEATEPTAGEADTGDLLLDFGDRRLECLIARFKPSHTIAHHIYDASAALAAFRGE